MECNEEGGEVRVTFSWQCKIGVKGERVEDSRPKLPMQNMFTICGVFRINNNKIRQL